MNDYSKAPRLPGLLLSRRVGESIQIGDDITIEVTEIRGKAVRLRINTPRETIIMRTELLAKGT